MDRDRFCDGSKDVDDGRGEWYRLPGVKGLESEIGMVAKAQELPSAQN